ncbi:hypothetical protein [Sphingomicrobium arenosum]|uniref:hypothetical protein n=1 Tax=Sphingomicrobium arenosum TaxID=2233861 RepID=UPI002240F9ED|nr:hypothetical protein [Sphingomicrobium arenosum]
MTLCLALLSGCGEDAVMVDPAGQTTVARTNADAPPGGDVHEAVVPGGWEVEAEARGDLTGDGAEEIALVMRRIVDSDARAADGSPFTPGPRRLVVARPTTGSAADILVTHATFVPAWDDPLADDPFAGLSIARGNLVVALVDFRSVGSWAASRTRYTFRWDEGARDFALIGYDKSRIDRSTLDEEVVSVNFLSGRRKHVGGRYEEGALLGTRWSDVDGEPPLLADLPEARDYRPPAAH